MSSSDATDDAPDWSLYPYDPAKPAPVIFAILLSVLGCFQIYQSFFRYQWKKFGTMMTWATSVWIAGFICRCISIYHDQSVNIFVAQYVLILMGPPLYAAAEYFILGRLISYLPFHAPIHPGRVFSTFFLLSAGVEALTANGAVHSQGDRPGQREAGFACLKAALILQSCVEAAFCSLVVTLEYRCHRAGNFPKRVRPVFWTLYVTTSMILVRCIVRVIEGFEDAKCAINTYCGTIATHEWFLWVFEIANITLFVILLAVFHPGKYLPQDSKIFLDPVDCKTERVGPGFSKADRRPIWVTILDPFNLYSIVTGKGMGLNKFWEEQQPVYNGGKIDTGKNETEISQGVAGSHGIV